MHIKLSGIELTYSYKKVLRGVNVEFAEGGIHALLGENGAGKSSLMKILTGSIKPSSGKIFINGREVAFKKNADSLKAGIACVYQRPFLSDHISVKDNLKIGLKSKVFNTGFAEAEKSGFLSGIDLDQKAGTLSGDQRFFTAFTGSLLRNPEVLILDEPTALLDSEQSIQLFQKLRSLAEKGMNIILITHKKEDLKYCDDITFLSEGLILDKQSDADFQNADIPEENPENRKKVSEKLDAAECKKLRKENCGVIPSDKTYLASNPELTITQLVCSTFKESSKPAVLKTHTEDIIRKAGINILPGEKVKNLSGGMLQRLILERELYSNPKVIYLEDPYQGLDAASSRRLEERIKDCAAKGSKVVYL